MWGDEYQVLVATHFNTGTYHNHFVVDRPDFSCRHLVASRSIHRFRRKRRKFAISRMLLFPPGDGTGEAEAGASGQAVRPVPVRVSPAGRRGETLDYLARSTVEVLA